MSQPRPIEPARVAIARITQGVTQNGGRANSADVEEARRVFEQLIAGAEPATAAQLSRARDAVLSGDLAAATRILDEGPPPAPSAPRPVSAQRPRRDAQPIALAAQRNGGSSPPRPSGKTADRTDVRNAEFLVEQFGGDLRHVGSWRKWLAWDGRRWSPDETSAVQEMAVRTARILFDRASEQYREATARDDAEALKRAKENMAWAGTSHGVSRIAAMVALARSKPSIAVHHDALDADPWLLNVANGTVDLRTGQLREHRRDDLMTKLAPVKYDPKATAPTWGAFLGRAMGGNAALIDYLQRITGYALTGIVREHTLAFFYGGGANGKSTFLSTTHAMLGDYATPAPRGLLFRSRGDRHPTELASLHGRRFVTCSEIEDGQAFDEALVKDLTGGDPIECRRMREDFWTFQPTHKLILAGNHKPTVRGDDEGIWRRMRLIPWTVTIPEAERDTKLAEKLLAELPGILAWAVRGCLEWQNRGLDAPEEVRAATKEYRDENDVVGQFFRLHVVFEPEATVARKALREKYLTFCDENGAEPLGAKRFSARLREHGVRETSVREGMRVIDGWRGVRLANELERQEMGRRDIGTCSEQYPYQSQTPAREDANRKSGPTSHYVPTDEGEPTFGDWVAKQGVRGNA